jgi:hypothetical protein
MVIEADACKAPMFMVLKIPHSRHYRNMAPSSNDSKAGDTLSSRHVSSCDVTRAVGM